MLRNLAAFVADVIRPLTRRHDNTRDLTAALSVYGPRAMTEHAALLDAWHDLSDENIAARIKEWTA
jgi:hypothetical protein